MVSERDRAALALFDAAGRSPLMTLTECEALALLDAIDAFDARCPAEVSP